MVFRRWQLEPVEGIPIGDFFVFKYNAFSALPSNRFLYQLGDRLLIMVFPLFFVMRIYFGFSGDQNGTWAYALY